MLKIISSKVQECYQHAAEASSRARQTDHAAVRKTFFDLERRWLSLARNYELSGQSTDFTGKLTHRLSALRSLAMNIPRVVCPECGKKMRLACPEPCPGVDVGKETTTFVCDCGEQFSYTVTPQL
jgi:hypothetical protein